MLQNTESIPRLAFVVSRTVSKRAVIRNTIRRRAREWVRTRVLSSLPSVDIVMIFSKGAAAAPRKELYAELERVFTHLTKK